MFEKIKEGIALLLVLFLVMLARTSIAHSQTVYLNAEEMRFYQLVNNFRARLNLPVFQIHMSLQNAARKHAEWMASQDFLTHFGPVENKTPFQRMDEEGYARYHVAGENVACGNGDAVKVFRQWVFSPGHLSNLLNPHFRQIGLARAGTGREKCPYYWTNDFGSQTDPSLDPAEITSNEQVTRIVAELTGPVPDGEIQIPRNTPAPNSPPPVPSLFIQCTIPYAVGKGAVTTLENVDTLLEANASPEQTTIKLTFYKNSQPLPYNPIVLSGTVVKNAGLPLYVVVTGAARGLDGFIIQFNSQNGKSQLDVFGSYFSSGLIECSMKGQ